MNKLKVILLSFILNLIFLSFSFSEIVKKIDDIVKLNNYVRLKTLENSI